VSNKVSYIFIAQDRYVKVVRKINAITEKVKRTVAAAGPAFVKLGKQVKLAGAKILKFGQNLKGIGTKLTLFATLPVALLGRSLIKAASDAEETESKFGVVFGDIGKKSQDVADNLAKNFVLAGSSARKLLGDTGDLLTGFGFMPDVALDISKQVQELSVDLASFTNFSGGAEGASAALTKALLGERESVKSLGISILEEDVKRKVAILSAQGMTFASMRQAKAFATLKIAQEQSKNALGDFTNTQHLFANQQRVMSERLLDVKEKFGKLLLPIALKAVKIFVKLIDIFESFSPMTKKIILVVGGLVAVVGPLLLLVGGLISAWPLLVAGFLVITGPIGLVLAALAAITFGFLAVKHNLFGLSDIVGGMIESIVINFQILKGEWDSVIASIVDKVFFVQDKIGSFIDKIASVKDVFSFGDDDLNINKRSENIISGGKSKTDINVQLRAPEGAIESVKSNSSGNTPGLNVGLNMVTQ
jgi:hypothetical protein